MTTPPGAALLTDFVDRCVTALTGCCTECDNVIDIIRSRAAATLGGNPVPERMNLHWTDQVDHPHDRAEDTVVHCVDANGRSYALLLDDEHREVLGDMLIDPPDPDEVAAENA